MTGGMICPPVLAAASIPAAKRGLNPCDLISGMVKVPVPTTFAAAEPENVPKAADEAMAAWAGPPRRRRVARIDIFMIASEAPVAWISTPNRMNTTTEFSMIDSANPIAPLVSSQKVIASRSHDLGAVE